SPRGMIPKVTGVHFANIRVKIEVPPQQPTGPNIEHVSTEQRRGTCVGVALPAASALIYIGCRMPTTGERFERAVTIMERLRAPGGCPWDREQTFDSIKPYTLEETYEVLEAIDNRDWPELAGELGDLLLQVL